MRFAIRFSARSRAFLTAGFATLLAGSAHAQVPPSGNFTATESCAATQSINGKNPGNVNLAVGTTYRAIGFNSAQRRYVLLSVPDATPARRWVSATCGTFQEGGTAPDDGDSAPTGLLPFFDAKPDLASVDFPAGAQKDISPLPPKLEPFDLKVAALCGKGFDAPVSQESFRQLLSYYPDVVLKLKQATGGELRPGRRGDREFLDDLTEIWFNRGGFKHIFCGEKDGNSIGGLHFHARYLQLQQEGIGGRIVRTSQGRDAREEVVDGSIYTLGVGIRQGGRLIAENPIKGYSYVLNAQELLIYPTRAFKQFQVSGRDSAACLVSVTDPAAPPFQAVFVKRATGIVTFYPDATPDTDRNRPCDR